MFKLLVLAGSVLAFATAPAMAGGHMEMEPPRQSRVSGRDVEGTIGKLKCRGMALLKGPLWTIL